MFGGGGCCALLEAALLPSALADFTGFTFARPKLQTPGSGNPAARSSTAWFCISVGTSGINIPPRWQRGFLAPLAARAVDCESDGAGASARGFLSFVGLLCRLLEAVGFRVPPTFALPLIGVSFGFCSPRKPRRPSAAAATASSSICSAALTLHEVASSELAT